MYLYQFCFSHVLICNHGFHCHLFASDPQICTSKLKHFSDIHFCFELYTQKSSSECLVALHQNSICPNKYSVILPQISAFPIFFFSKCHHHPFSCLSEKPGSHYLLFPLIVQIQNIYHSFHFKSPV